MAPSHKLMPSPPIHLLVETFFFKFTFGFSSFECFSNFRIDFCNDTLLKTVFFSFLLSWRSLQNGIFEQFLAATYQIFINRKI